jgi:hypothetical protein
LGILTSSGMQQGIRLQLIGSSTIAPRMRLGARLPQRPFASSLSKRAMYLGLAFSHLVDIRLSPKWVTLSVLESLGKSRNIAI